MEKSTTVQNSDIIANDASFANALSNVEPHQHFCGHQSIPKTILWGNKFDLLAYSIIIKQWTTIFLTRVFLIFISKHWKLNKTDDACFDRLFFPLHLIMKHMMKFLKYFTVPNLICIYIWVNKRQPCTPAAETNDSKFSDFLHYWHHLLEHSEMVNCTKWVFVILLNLCTILWISASILSSLWKF